MIFRSRYFFFIYQFSATYNISPSNINSDNKSNMIILIRIVLAIIIPGKVFLKYETIFELLALKIFSWTKHRSNRLEVFCRKVLLKIMQNSQENTCARVSSLIKLQASCLQTTATLLKRRLWHRCFPANFTKFTEHLQTNASSKTG